jgi:hypothetical protein
MLRGIVKCEPLIEMRARQVQLSAMQPAIADRPMASYQRGPVVSTSGQLEQLFGGAMR